MTTSPVVAFAANKGGVGKTTISATTAHAFVLEGLTVLAIDMDPQGNLTSALGADAMGEGFADLIHSERTLADVITPTECGVDLVPPGRELSAVGQALTTQPGGERVLARALAALDANTDYDYDVIIIDTPPDLGRLTLNGIAAASHVIAVINPARWAAEGGATISALVDQVNALELGRPVFLGAVVNKVPSGKRLVRDMVMESLEETDFPLLDTRIPQRTSLEQAEFVAAPVSFIEPKGKEAKLFRALAKEITQRMTSEQAVAI
jgi:chromosome partitioning protein